MPSKPIPMIRTVVAPMLVLAAIFLAPACGTTDSGPDATERDVSAGHRLTVYTSCFPIDWLTRRIAGEHADVVHILPIGEDPPEWTPPVEVVGKMQQADLIVINGATFEGWAKTATLPDGKIIDTTAGLKDSLIVIEGETHSHGKDGEHTHAGTDPHTWVDPLLASAQAEAIRDALIRANGGHADAFKASFTELQAELQSLHKAYEKANAGYSGETMATSHPAFNYIGRRYDWKLLNFGFEPDEEPAAEPFAHLSESVKEDTIRYMLWESMPGDELKAKFEATGVQVVFLDPLEQPPEGKAYDYLAQARANIETLQQLFPETDQATTGK